jgi:HSP20 family protein
MTMSRWDPFNDLLRIQKRMNTLFEESMGRTSEEGGDAAGGRWSPAVDIYETADKIVLVADLPGIDQESLEVRVENNTLILKGERRMQKNVQQENYHRIERGYGAFQRTFALPGSVDQDRIQADYRHGILEIGLPKSETSHPKRIQVQIGRS